MPEAVSHLGVFGSAAHAAAPEMTRMRRVQSSAMPSPAPQVTAALSQSEATIEFQDSAAAPSNFPDLSDQFEAFDFGDFNYADGFIGMAAPDLEAPLPAPAGAAELEFSMDFSGAPPDNRRLQIVSTTGLDAAAIAHLTQHLQPVQLPSGFSGTVVFEFQVSTKRVLGVPTGKHWVVQLVLDEQDSTLQEAAVLDILRRSLITWKPEGSIVGTVRLVLQIN
jgi:hypothetical protein